MKNILVLFLFFVSFCGLAQVNPLDNVGGGLLTVGDLYASEEFLPCVSEQNGITSKFTARLNLYTQNIEYQKDSKTYVVSKYARVCFTEDSVKRCFKKVLNLDKETKVGLVEELTATTKGSLSLWRKPISGEAMNYGAEKRIEVKFVDHVVFTIAERTYVFIKSKKGYKEFLKTFNLPQTEYSKEIGFFEDEIKTKIL